MPFSQTVRVQIEPQTELTSGRYQLFRDGITRPRHKADQYANGPVAPIALDDLAPTAICSSRIG